MSDGAAIRLAQGSRDIALARALFQEYAAWLAVDLCFQGFEQELASLPGDYSPPRGRLLLAGTPGDAFACAALRPLPEAGDSSATTTVAEMKRMYVQPRARGGGWGRRLAVRILDEARAIGYRQMKLDTLAHLAQARALYASLGFVECAPYYRNPIGGTVYLALDLTAVR